MSPGDIRKKEAGKYRGERTKRIGRHSRHRRERKRDRENMIPGKAERRAEFDFL